jgi:Mg2+ and Co2+ transporter CorA
MLERVARLLNEAVMGFLAIAALSCALVPLLFSVSPAVHDWLDGAEWIIVALFAVEYGVNLSLAKDRRKFALDPWRVLDVVILVAPFASLLPFVGDAVRSSPALRLLRLFRAIVFGARAGGRLRPAAASALPSAPSGPPRVTMLHPGAAPETGRWEELLRWAASPTSDWLHASNLEPARLGELATAAGVSRALVDGALGEASYPRFEAGPRWTALSLWLPEIREGRTYRQAFLLLATDDDLLTLSLHPADLHARFVRATPAAGVPALPWGAASALGLLRMTLGANEELMGHLERQVRRLEEQPADESPEEFFEETFRLKKEITVAKADLWRLRGILTALADGRRSLPGVAEPSRAALRALADEADYLYETAETIRQGLISLIDLHLNVASHDTNRFMRLLAIASVLALIPAVTGGLLGMNLRDSPWPITLPQVAFATAMLMLGVLYAFLAKGWMR